MAKRILILSWGVYFAGLALLLAFPKYLMRHWTASAILALGLALLFVSVAYAFALAYREIVKRPHLNVNRWAANSIERAIITGWILCIAILLAALFFPQARFLPGPEVLLALFCAVVLSSLAYGTYLVVRHIMERTRR